MVCALTSESGTQAEPPYRQPRPSKSSDYTVTQNLPNWGEHLNRGPPLGIPGPIERLSEANYNASIPLPLLRVPEEPFLGSDLSIEKYDPSASSQTERFPESNCNAPVPSPLLRIPTEVPVSYEQSLSIEEGSPWVSSRKPSV